MTPPLQLDLELGKLYMLSAEATLRGGGSGVAGSFVGRSFLRLLSGENSKLARSLERFCSEEVNN